MVVDEGEDVRFRMEVNSMAFFTDDREEQRDAAQKYSVHTEPSKDSTKTETDVANRPDRFDRWCVHLIAFGDCRFLPRFRILGKRRSPNEARVCGLKKMR